VSPDVSSLGVNSEDAAETGPEGGHRRSMSMQEVIIVLQPVWQHVKGNDSPAPLPNLKNKSTVTYTRTELIQQSLCRLWLKACEE